MPAHRKSTAVLEARGSFRNNPERRRTPEPEVTDPLGSPPDHLSDAEREAWLEIASDAPVGLLKRSDRHAVELAAGLLAERRELGAAFQGSKAALLARLLAQMGGTPQGRCGLTLPVETKPSNVWASLDD